MAASYHAASPRMSGLLSDAFAGVFGKESGMPVAADAVGAPPPGAASTSGSPAGAAATTSTAAKEDKVEEPQMEFQRRTSKKAPG